MSVGNTLLNLRQGCGEKILGEGTGSVQYSLHPNSLLFNRITSDSTEKLLDVTCTWIIDAHENQTFWIEVSSVGEGAHIGIKFGDGNTLTYEREERALFSGTGRTIIKWSLRRTDETFATLHLSKSIKYHAFRIFFILIFFFTNPKSLVYVRSI